MDNTQNKEIKNIDKPNLTFAEARESAEKSIQGIRDKVQGFIESDEQSSRLKELAGNALKEIESEYVTWMELLDVEGEGLMDESMTTNFKVAFGKKLEEKLAVLTS
ncbi:MAG: hypothetical protein WCX95_05050 [Candidatus Gracilibacteria bacterium]